MPRVGAIDTERALLAPERISQIVGYIREHFDQKTRRSSAYRLGDRRLAGFNSLFATASIDAAKRYYAEFVRQQADLPSDQRVKVGLIYSYAANEEEADGLLPEEQFGTGQARTHVERVLGLRVCSRPLMWSRCCHRRGITRRKRPARKITQSASDKVKPPVASLRITVRQALHRTTDL